MKTIKLKGEPAFLASSCKHPHGVFHIFLEKDITPPFSNSLCGQKIGTHEFRFKKMVFCKKCLKIAKKRGIIDET